MISVCCFFSLCTDVVVGFREPLTIEVEEGPRVYVTLCLDVTVPAAGGAPFPFTVSVNTRDGTAGVIVCACVCVCVCVCAYIVGVSFVLIIIPLCFWYLCQVVYLTTVVDILYYSLHSRYYGLCCS